MRPRRVDTPPVGFDLTLVPPSFRRRRGVTLIELLVVLTLIGLAAALTAPALLRDRVEPVPDAGRVVAYARAVALRRAETLALRVERDGRWTLAVARGDSLPVAHGVIGAAAPARLLVTPLGLCIPDDDASTVAWDPSACRAAEATR